MNQQDPKSLTLFDLLAREWTTDAAITAMQLNAQQSAAAYRLANGTVAIADVSDNDAPEERIHISAENGRSTIKPRATAAQPLIIVDLPDETATLLSPLDEADFLIGTDTALYRLSPTGEQEAFNLDFDDQVKCADRCFKTGRLACAGNARIAVFDSGTTISAMQLDLDGAILAVGFAPDGKSIALAHEGGLKIWDLEDDQRVVDIEFPGHPQAVNWSPGSKWIACPLADGGFQLTCAWDKRTAALKDYPAPVNSIAWNTKADALVTSGAYRITAWSMDKPPIDDPASGAFKTGRPGLVAISAVSCHPKRNLVAVGYDNGFIAILQLGSSDELVLNSQDRGAVSHLIWSRDGRRLIAATDRRTAAIISLPPQMFKR